MAALEREVLVCYDVADSKARSKLCNALKDLGLQSLQESVFWGRLRAAEERAVAREFDKLLDATTDRGLLLPVGLADDKRVVCFGYSSPPFAMPPPTIIV